MAAGDILSVTVRANGFLADVVVEGLSSGGTYDFGGDWNGPAFGYTSDNDPSGAKIVSTITSPGYSGSTLTTVNRTAYGVPHQTVEGSAVGVGCMRKPWVGTGDPVPDETPGGGNVTIVIILSDLLYVSDTATITFAAGWYTQGGTPTNAYSGAVVNNSTTTYPLPIAQWDSIAGALVADRLTGDFRLAVNAWARHGVAAVEFDMDGASHNQNELVTTKTAVLREVSGYYAECYRTSLLPISGFTQGETITGNFIVYPVVGNATAKLDSRSYTSSLVLGELRNPAPMTCDKNDALANYGYVDPVSGLDTNPGTLASPYLTIAKAVNAGRNGAYLLAGNHTATIDPGTRVPNSEWFRVELAPGETKSTVSFHMINASSDIKWLQFVGITIKAGTQFSRLLGGGEDHTRFTNCTFDRNGQTYSSFGIVDDCPLGLFENCDGDLGEWGHGSANLNDTRYGFDGCILIASNRTIKGPGRIVASTVEGALIQVPDIPTLNSMDNMIFHNSTFGEYDGVMIDIEHNHDIVTGLVVCGCIIESVGVGGQPIAQVFNEENSQNVLWFNNTNWGQRTLWMYNWTSTVPPYGVKQRRMLNYWQYFAHKGDDMNPRDAVRIGQWESMCNVGAVGELNAHVTFHSQFNGLFGLCGTTGVDLIPSFVDDAGQYSGSNLGGGDYRDTNPATASFTWAGDKPCEYDLTGRQRPNGVAYRGAVLPVPNGVGATLTLA